MSDSSVTPWTIVHQASLFAGFPKQGDWSGLPLSSPGAPPDPGIEPMAPAQASRFFTTEPPGKPIYLFQCVLIPHLVYEILYNFMNSWTLLERFSGKG